MRFETTPALSAEVARHAAAILTAHEPSARIAEEPTAANLKDWEALALELLATVRALRVGA